MFTDFHSHILPGIDDGSSSVEESLKLLEIEAEQGIKRVVATPHFYANHDSPERFLERRENAKALLEKALENRIDMPKIEIGAEVHFFRGISDSEFLPELTITNKRFILIEMPDSDWSESMYSELESIYYQRGITPIIAHMDRYISPFRTRKIPEKFSKMPVLVQANASFFLEGGLTSKLALKLLKEDKIQLLGSDCHNLTKRPPKLGLAAEVIRKKLGEEYFERIENYGETVFSK
ncbi:MAG: capsular polysaccharide biosynthesis protein [Oscillospiraceae bacterium]|nr:capsular polysaccharide biosynthesis protein [Oscillospiraceae bacterium]MBP1575780.1 capsular polysaccharide biosynthesis protein [Oscillospiraceae bacterium]MBQ5323187.1 capsular polysaccharide biosynthesis protein [Oscillospiraceae bacterium]